MLSAISDCCSLSLSVCVSLSHTHIHTHKVLLEEKKVPNDCVDILTRNIKLRCPLLGKTGRGEGLRRMALVAGGPEVRCSGNDAVPGGSGEQPQRGLPPSSMTHGHLSGQKGQSELFESRGNRKQN